MSSLSVTASGRECNGVSNYNGFLVLNVTGVLPSFSSMNLEDQLCGTWNAGMAHS